MTEERLEILNDIGTLPLAVFIQKYNNALCEDGKIKEIQFKEPRPNGYFSNSGRRYYHIGPLFRKASH